jgi:hypothetical protein
MHDSAPQWHLDALERDAKEWYYFAMRESGCVFSTMNLVAHALNDSRFMSCHRLWLFEHGTLGAVCFFRLDRLVGAKKPPVVGLIPTSAKIFNDITALLVNMM